MKNIILSIILTFSMLSTITYAADAGQEQQVSSSDLVSLDATNSMTYKDGEIVKYKWKQIKRKSDPKVHLSDKKSATPTFIAPDVEKITKLIFRLETKEHYACKDKRDSDKQKCKKYTTKDTVNIFVHPSNNAQNNDTDITGFKIDGKIIDLNSIGISGASINIGTQTAITDENGSYSIMNVEVASRVSIDVTHPNYIANSRIVEVRDQNVTLDIKLDQAKATLTFSSTNGGNVAHDGASVVLPADGYVDGNGTAYNGDVTVKMSYYPISRVSGRETIPGTFEGIDGNETFPIESFGFMNVELTDTEGKPLNLSPESNATIKLPRDTTLPYKSTLPLWYYDAVLGYWVEEGIVTLSGSTYIGTVSHFTSWSLFNRGTGASLSGCVEDINGTLISNANVKFTSTNWDSRIVPTDGNGSIFVHDVLTQTDLTFTAYRKIGDTIYYGEYPTAINLLEDEHKLLPDCVIIKEELNLPNTINVLGTVTEYNLTTDTYEARENENISIYAGLPSRAVPYEFVTSGTSNADGTFSFTFPIGDRLEYIIYFRTEGNVSNFYKSTTFKLQPNKSTYDLGILQFKRN